MTIKRDFVAQERAALADAFAECGPDQPTLCEGWQTRDLLQHLVLRDAGPLIAVREGKDHAEARVREAAWADLIQEFRDGPPSGSLFRLPGANTAANSEEFFVHHEDVRRGVPGWTRRELSCEIEDAIWRRLRSPFGRIAARRAGVGLHLHRSDGVSGEAEDGHDGAAGAAAPHAGDAPQPDDGGKPGAERPVIPDRFARGEHATLRAKRPGVIVSGPPSELLMFLFGRQRAADVTLHGPAEAVEQLMHAELGI